MKVPRGQGLLTCSGQDLRSRLLAGSPTTLGSAVQLAAEAATHPEVCGDLVEALHDHRPLVVARAASALLKIGRGHPELLHPLATGLLHATLHCAVPRARWCLWQVIGRLPLSRRNHGLAVDALWEALNSPGILERAAALQGVADRSSGDPALAHRVREIVARIAVDDGSAAMRARARLLRLHFARSARS